MKKNQSNDNSILLLAQTLGELKDEVQALKEQSKVAQSEVQSLKDQCRKQEAIIQSLRENNKEWVQWGNNINEAIKDLRKKDEYTTRAFQFINGHMFPGAD